MLQLGLIALLACAGEEPPPPVSAPVPGAGTGDGPVTVPVPEVTRPDGRAAVMGSEIAAEDLPPIGLESLSERQASDVLVALNTTVGPCPECMDRGYSIARCLANGVPECENVPAVARRAVRLGRELGFLELLPRIRYEEPWRQLPADRLGPPGSLPVVVAVDYADPFSREVWPALQELAGAYGDQLYWSVLHRPDTERHPLAERAARLVLAADRRGAGRRAHEALLSRGAPLDAAALDALLAELGLDDAALADPPLGERLAADRALADALDIRATPSLVIGGYLVRGARGAPYYSALIDDLLADAADPWPGGE